MFLGIQWLGWIILMVTALPVIALLIIVAARLGVLSRAFGGTALIVALPYVVVIGEAAWVEYNWQAMCATATTDVKRKVVVEGFFDDGFYDRWDELIGFSYVEWKDHQGGFWRGDRDSTGKLIVKRIEKPTARYWWHMSRFPIKVAYLIERGDESIVDTQSNEVIAHSVTGYRKPAFVDRLWRRFFDSAPDRCGTGRIVRFEALLGTGQVGNAK